MMEAGTRITFTPTGGDEVELAAAGSMLVDGLGISAESEVFEAEGVLADEDFFRPLGGAACRVTFEVEVAAADQGAVEVAMLADVPFGQTGELRFEIPGADTLLFQSANLAEPRTTVPATGAPETRRRYEFATQPPNRES